MSSSKLQSIAENIPGYSIMADECVAVSNHEQFAVCLHWVDDSLEIHKDFLCLYNIPDTKADTITEGITQNRNSNLKLLSTVL